MPLKLLGPNGGSTAGAKSERVTNNSWGGGGFSPALVDALNKGVSGGGGPGGATDQAGNALAADKTWSFITR